MAIDYLEYYSGHCFGAIGANSECLNDELLGAEIDAELEEHIESEVFGASNLASKKGIIVIQRKQNKLKELMQKLLHHKRKARRTLVQAKALSKKAGQKSTRSHKHLRTELAGKHRELAKIKAEMHKLVKKIMGLWNSTKDKFKKHWDKKHHKGSWRSPASFIAKHGPHTLQY